MPSPLKSPVTIAPGDCVQTCATGGANAAACSCAAATIRNKTLTRDTRMAQERSTHTSLEAASCGLGPKHVLGKTKWCQMNREEFAHSHQDSRSCQQNFSFSEQSSAQVFA